MAVNVKAIGPGSKPVRSGGPDSGVKVPSARMSTIRLVEGPVDWVKSTKPEKLPQAALKLTADPMVDVIAMVDRALNAGTTLRSPVTLETSENANEKVVFKPIAPIGTAEMPRIVTAPVALSGMA